MVNIIDSSLYNKLNSLRGYASAIPGSSLNGNNPIIRDEDYAENPKKYSHVVDLDKTHDMILPDNKAIKLKAKIEQASYLPSYVKKGLKGHPDSNFFEFLKVANIPYYVGGPLLVWCFAAGGPKAAPLAKQKGVGVALYYGAAFLADKLIKKPVKWVKGIDLDRMYQDVVETRDTTKSGMPKKKKEYHKAYESVDFSRWDLMYNTKQETLGNKRLINKTFDEFANKMGVNKEVNDSDSLTKGEIKKTIIKSRAWSMLLMIPMVTSAIGIADQKAWESFGINMKHQFANAFNHPFLKLPEYESKFKKSMNVIKYVFSPIKDLGKIINEHFVSKFVQSTKAFWKGGEKGLSKIIGKASIIGMGAVYLLALRSVLSNKLRKKEVVDINEFPSLKKEQAIEGKEVKNG